MYNSASTFDWDGAIAKNRDALFAILESLVTLLGLQASRTVTRLSQRFHRKVLRVLKPAESAVRRLIVMAARNLVAKPVTVRPGRKKAGGIRRQGKGTSRPPSFQLFDPRVAFDFDPGEPAGPHRSPPGPSQDSDGLIDGKPLIRRLEAVRLALADLPGQARRLVKAKARRDKNPRLQFLSPMRPGRPPGLPRKLAHEVDHVLKECHLLARDVPWPNTS